MLLLSSLWNVQANGKKVRTGNRSDAILLPSAVIHYARPNLFLGDDEYAGPADIWNPKKGFLVQSINPESYNLNFPTTGAHNLYFDLLITGIDVRDLTWKPVTHEGITATVTNVVANDGWIPWEDFAKVVARVKLTGPEARNQWDNPNPSRIAVPKLPQTFELVGRDRYGIEVVKYGFVLRQWFVVRDNPNGYVNGRRHSDQLAWCNNIGYRMPRIRDLTNAVSTGVRFPVGASPSSSDNNYMRYIGAGFFSEWGCMYDYTGANFVDNRYWTSDTDDNYWMSDTDDDYWTEAAKVKDSHPFNVGSHFGNFYGYFPFYSTYVVCSLDLRP
ncbi:hypothetical protein [Gilliamella sp. Bif1-4]|uniref:hypothetical protein n=1 Tax=Gilliamella sp. Bif1-4 TaxID=3120233 RepID=UPI00080DFE1F|nr:hypothetical protein [Gilliamella apicola]OCG41987.1 hypothetical protein A9G25_04450 [Gilliamella apicola]